MVSPLAGVSAVWGKVEATTEQLPDESQVTVPLATVVIVCFATKPTRSKVPVALAVINLTVLRSQLSELVTVPAHSTTATEVDAV
jgi:hypothetical protein